MTKIYSIGTYITEPIGNNAFSYNERIALGSTGKLYVPKLIQGTVADLQRGSEICFEEVVKGKLVSCSGLKNFLQTTYHGVPVYIVDNHNHALSFRHKYKENLRKSSEKNLLPSVIHIDQHTDLKPNEHIFSGDNIETFVNKETNVGNFITAAINAGILNEVIQVRTDYALQQLGTSSLSIRQAGFKLKANYILDIDIDFREGKELSQNDIIIIRQLMQQSQLVTIATSPYFMDQSIAIDYIQKILSKDILYIDI